LEQRSTNDAGAIWWELVHLVCGLDPEETLALEQQPSPFDEDLDLLHTFKPKI
jgi:hypothetical protein